MINLIKTACERYKTAVKTFAIEEVMFLRGCQLLGLLSLVFLVVKSSDSSGKWFLCVGQFVISASDQLLHLVKTRSSDKIFEAFVMDPLIGN